MYLDDRLVDFYASDDVSYCWKMCFICFLIFYVLQVGPPKRRAVWGNFPPTLPFDGPGCVNKVLINALKN